MTAIPGYTQSILAPQLLSLGLNKHQREIVIGDVTQRLESLLSHWSDLSFRRTVLVLGTEEASFWEPRNANLEVRALVVATVRNSLITDLNASRAYTPQLRSRKQFLPDERMPWITGEAIKYFQAVNLDTVRVQAGRDIFGSLPRRFPNAWQVLSLLGNSSDNEIVYKLPRAEAESMGASGVLMRGKDQTVIESGIDPGFDDHLAKLLRLVEKKEMEVFLTPSFKHITRNPEKLLRVLDHVLRFGGTVLTPNYLLSPTHLARRNPLLRPIHFRDEFNSRIADPNGLSLRHRELLASFRGNE